MQIVYLRSQVLVMCGNGESMKYSKEKTQNIDRCDAVVLTAPQWDNRLFRVEVFKDKMRRSGNDCAAVTCQTFGFCIFVTAYLLRKPMIRHEGEIKTKGTQRKGRTT